MRPRFFSTLLRSTALLCIALSGAVLVTACGKKAPAQGQNSKLPHRTPDGGISGETNFAQLMHDYPNGHPRTAPWIGSWWPYSTGGIVDAAKSYESATGHTGAVSWETAHHGATTPGLQPWWGHCNGWAAAATLFPEPLSMRVRNGVSFSATDQKALLSEVAMEVDADFFGQRDDSDDPSNPTFQDVYPDQFFLVLTNYTGNGMPLVLDRYAGSQVWNQPIAAYVHAPVTPDDVLPPDPSAPGVTRVNVSTQLWWARDDVAADAATAPFTWQDNDSFQSRIYEYEVWLDGPVKFDANGKMVSSGNVILATSGKVATGGAWKNGDLDLMNSHPDYLWVPHQVTPSTGFSNPEIDPGWVTGNFGN